MQGQTIEEKAFSVGEKYKPPGLAAPEEKYNVPRLHKFHTHDG